MLVVKCEPTAVCVFADAQADKKGMDLPSLTLGKEFVVLKQYFSKCGLNTSISIIWELHRNADSQIPPQTY